MTTTLLIWGHEAAVLAYAIFAIMVAVRGARTLLAALFLAALLVTAVWAQSFVAVYLGYAPDWLEGVTSTARDASWLALALALMHRHAGDTPYFRVLVAGATVLLGLQLAL